MVRRTSRESIIATDAPPVGGLSSVISGRRQRAVQTAPAAPVDPLSAPSAQFFGAPDDTPIMELLKSIAPVSQGYRNDGHVHVSDVVSKCVRKIALMELLNQRHPQEVIRDGQGITFAIGDALHDYVKGRFIAGHPDKVFADWSCLCGETRERALYSQRKAVCPSCNTPTSKHNEIPFIDDEFNLGGNPDVLLYLDQYGAYYVVEIKSISGKGYDELVRPMPDHVVQVTFYWYLLKKLGYPVVDRVSILYVNKEFSFKMPYKEYMIEPSVERTLGPYLEDLEALKVARAGGALPPRTMCGTATAPMAKKCPVCVSCFQME